MADFNEIVKQAREMQEKMKQAQEEMANLIVEGESGAGLVKIRMNGKYDVKKVQLNSSLMEEDKEVIEDLVAAAINDAVRKLEEKNRDTLGGMTSGLGLPDNFKFPF
ncbi:MAG: YbaB/EbfC family nucleoid-associated protein [Pseudohongiellaceae bacterium]